MSLETRYNFQYSILLIAAIEWPTIYLSRGRVRGRRHIDITFKRRHDETTHPCPMTWFCHAESLANSSWSLASFSSNSFATTSAFASNPAAQGNRSGLSVTFQNGFAVSPSTCSSEGWWPGTSPWGGGISPRALNASRRKRKSERDKPNDKTHRPSKLETHLFPNVRIRSISIPLVAYTCSTSSSPPSTSSQNCI